MPREPEQPVRRTVCFNVGGYEGDCGRGGHDDNSAVRDVMIRFIVSAVFDFGVGSAVEPESEGGGVRTVTSFEIEGFSNRVLMVIGRERWFDRDVRKERAVRELIPRS